MTQSQVSSALMRAEERLEAAVQRIEAALRRGRADAGGQIKAERDAYARDCELLRVECDALRRELDATLDRHARLTSASREVEARLDRVIGELEELADE